MLKQDNITKEQIDKNVMELNTGNNNTKYKVAIIWDSAVYAMKSELGHLSKLY